MTNAIERDLIAHVACLLDVDQPDWFRRIDLDYLDLDRFYDCVLGQVYGSYSEGKRRLGMNWA